jgi:3-phytase
MRDYDGAETTMKRGVTGFFATAMVAALTGVACPAQQASPVPAIVGQGTEPTAVGGPNRSIVLLGGDVPLIVGTAELGGLEIYELSGKRVGSVPAGEAVSLDVRYSRKGSQGLSALVAAADATGDSLRFFRPQGRTLVETSTAPLKLDMAVEGVCFYRSFQDDSLYAIAVGDGGEVDQYLLFETAGGGIGGRQVRRLHVPSTAEHCAADDRTGMLYVSEQGVGVWRFNAEPETDNVPALVDAVRLGRISEEVGGLALIDGGAGAQWLLAANSTGGQINVYDHGKDDAYVGSFSVGSGEAAVKEPGGLYAIGPSVSVPHGMLLVTDEEAASGANYKVVGIDRIASALGINSGQQAELVPAASPQFPLVRPILETPPMANAGDAADDPAIWANRADPAQSLVIGTDKQGGLHLYDMTGKSLQFTGDGKMNNVDLREGFRLGGRDIILVTASDRTNKSVAIYELDTDARRLTGVADGIQASGLSDPYGQCMYRSPKTGRYYVFISDPDGLVRQWQLVPTRAGKVGIKKVRDIKFSSQTEGCVADDTTGILYVAEEDIGLWRISAEPNGGAVPVRVDTVEANSRLKDDLEGVGLYDLGNGRGYLVVSSQGNNSYAVYRREGDHAYLGSFSIVADAAKGIDGVSETDGLDVTSANLGPGLEHGALVAQDGRNVLPVENQNFKIVPWAAIAQALNLEVRR